MIPAIYPGLIKGVKGMAEIDDLPDDLPGVDKDQLSKMLGDDLQDKDQPTAAMAVKPEVEPSDEGQPITDLAQFKTPEALMAAYKELQGTFTKTAQERAALKEQLAKIYEQLELQRLSTPMQQQPVPQKSFDEIFVENPELAVDTRVERAVEQKLHVARIADVLGEEEGKNPEEFQDRYAYAMHMKQFYPNLTSTAQGVKKLFELGDKFRMDRAKKNAEQNMKLLFGDDVDIDKFKELIKKDSRPPEQTSQNKNLAYMPDTSSGTRTRTSSTKGNVDVTIQDAVGKGDPDTVIRALFDKALSV
jgi:hypothetical protein